MKYNFPKGFLWGAATSAYQVEGGIHNDWTEWEGSQKRIEALEKAGKRPDEYISGRACDHYNRFREDFDIAKSLGHNAHRFSIEWSRIEPEEGKFDEREIEHYREVIKGLRDRGIEPFVTLWHWTLPLWLRDRGGVLARDFPERFARYAARMGREFKGSVRLWMTLNEPTSIIANSYYRGVWPPNKSGFGNAQRAYRAFAEAHRLAYAALHAETPEASVGFGNVLVYAEPYGASPLDRLSVAVLDYWSNRKFLKMVGDTNDYYALQYYFHIRLQFPQRIRNENTRVSDMGWELYPEGLYHLIMRFKAHRKPVYITEHGLADAEDLNRAWYIRASLGEIAKAIRDGANVRGYLHWSLLDNFEWDKGFWPRFGLVEVDYKTLERKIRPSAWEYKKIIEMSAIEIPE